MKLLLVMLAILFINSSSSKAETVTMDINGCLCNCSCSATLDLIQEQACEDGWNQYKDKCFKRLSEKYTYDQAHTACNNESSTLAVVPDQGTLHFIQDNLDLEGDAFHRIYLHGNDTSWTQGGVLDLGNHQNNISYEGRDCFLWKGLEFRSQPCNWHKKALCENPIDPNDATFACHRINGDSVEWGDMCYTLVYSRSSFHDWGDANEACHKMSASSRLAKPKPPHGFQDLYNHYEYVVISLTQDHQTGELIHKADNSPLTSGYHLLNVNNFSGAIKAGSNKIHVKPISYKHYSICEKPSTV